MGIGFKELIILLIVVLIVFGTKRLRNAGSDLGEAVKGFKKGMREDGGDKAADADADASASKALPDPNDDTKPQG